MGSKNRYNRRHFTDDEIQSLFVECMENGELYSPFSKKLFDTTYKWRNDIIRNMDVESCNKFLFKFEDVRYCKYSGEVLTETEYSYSERYKGYKGFKKYKLKYIEMGIWRNRKKSNQEREKISKNIKKYYSTEEGKLRAKLTGENNSKKLKEYFKTDKGIQQIKEVGKKQSELMKEKIKNGEFTPNITNSWTHWKAIIKIENIEHKFRSSWEACFFLCNDYLKYEYLRIPYVDENGINRTYVGDFYDCNANILYEIKPVCEYNKQKTKISSAIDYCIINGIKFIWINENNILKYIDISKFDDYNMIQYNKMIKGIK
jgi:hypothetical protein